MGILVIIVAVVFFALKNAQQVYVDFWLWKVDSNLSLVIVISVTFGAFSSFLLSLPYRAKKNKEIRKKDERIKFLDNKISLLAPKSSESENHDNNEIDRI